MQESEISGIPENETEIFLRLQNRKLTSSRSQARASAGQGHAEKVHLKS